MNDTLINTLVLAVSQAVTILIRALEAQGVNPREVLASVKDELDRIDLQAIRDADDERAVFTSASASDKPNP